MKNVKTRVGFLIMILNNLVLFSFIFYYVNYYDYFIKFIYFNFNYN